jgi:DNA-binding winged helix-turn-helix (wHTH) protein/tetratricopeptide (TPR) repeat protein
MSLENFPNFLLNFSERDVKGEEKHSYRFKSFRLDVEERQLVHNNSPVPLTPKAFDVLAVLVERSGHLVEKDELLKLVWADSFVEEANVARIVHTLRRVLGEDENGNKFIETVAKKGYRFVAKVTEVSEPTALKQANGNEQSSIAVENLTTSDFTAATDRTETRNDKAAASEPAPKTRVILFGVGFLTAVFLLLMLSFNFQSDSAGGSKKIKLIAVLPLKPIDTTNRNELYEIGIADSLIYRLSSMKGFIVRPLSATRKYANLEQDALAAGRDQQVDYVLASNYQIADGKIRITAQLFNISSGQIEETYKSEKDAANVFAVQDAIASEVGNLLQARFGTTSRSTLATRGTNIEEAYRLYLQGKNLTAKRNPRDAKKAVEYFEQAIQLDPNYATAFAGMANAYISSAFLGGGLPREEYEKAQKAVKKALELDDNLAEAYSIRGAIKYGYDWDFDEAERDFQHAVELDPNSYVEDRPNYLINRGRFDEAIAVVEKQLEIDPNSIVLQRHLGRVLYFARRYDEAIVQLKRVIELDPDMWTAYGLLWLAYEMKGDYAGAYMTFIENQKRNNPELVEIYQKAYETAGWEGVRRKKLEIDKQDENKPNSNHFTIARQYALFGDKEQAFVYLNKAIERRHPQVLLLSVDPTFDSLRGDPRFDELVRRIGLK